LEKSLKIEYGLACTLYFDEVRAFHRCTSTVKKLGLIQFKDTKGFLSNALQHYQAGS